MNSILNVPHFSFVLKFRSSLLLWSVRAVESVSIHTWSFLLMQFFQRYNFHFLCSSHSMMKSTRYSKITHVFLSNSFPIFLVYHLLLLKAPCISWLECIIPFYVSSDSIFHSSLFSFFFRLFLSLLLLLLPFFGLFWFVRLCTPFVICRSLWFASMYLGWNRYRSFFWIFGWRRVLTETPCRRKCCGASRSMF